MKTRAGLTKTPSAPDYSPPRLSIYGAMAALTAAGSNGSPENASAAKGMGGGVAGQALNKQI